MSVGIILYHVITGRAGIIHKGRRHDTYFQKYSGACIRVFQKSFLKIVLGTQVTEKLSQGLNYQLQSKYQYNSITYIKVPLWSLVYECSTHELKLGSSSLAL